MKRTTDGATLALLVGGVSLAVVTALFLPTLHVRAADSRLLEFSSWEAVPVMTALKFLALAAAVAATFMPRLQPLRLPLTLAAIIVLFLPPLAALVAAISHWTELRSTIVGLSGSPSPWVNPGWGLLVLVGAAALLGAALWREEHPHGST